MYELTRLVKENAEPTRLKCEHLEIFISKINGDFKKYTGPAQFEEKIEQRDGNSVRVLQFSDLMIPAAYRYIMVRSGLREKGADFSNLNGLAGGVTTKQGVLFTNIVIKNLLILLKHFTLNV